MGQYANAEWYHRRRAQYTAKYGAVPPPWVYAETSHPYSIRWRMGEGETLIMVFQEWWEQQAFSEEERLAYFRKWPPPPRWISWMADAIWDLEPPEDDDDIDYVPYYHRLAQLGFTGIEDIERDLDDPKWLELESKGCA
jgi:hypothetical protein